VKHLLLFAALVGSLAGCTSLKQADTTQFYLLSPGKPPVSEAKFAGLLYVAPIEPASYLEDQGIVTRHEESRLEFSARHQWAQPLRENFTQVLRQNLAAVFGPEHVHPLTRQRPRVHFISVQVRVDRFDLVEKSEAVLLATWSLTDSETGQALHVQTTRATQPVASGKPDFSNAVAALSRTVEDLGQEIARAVQALPSAPK
jgi:uncharacterized lipoprotein YmbA